MATDRDIIDSILKGEEPGWSAVLAWVNSTMAHRARGLDDQDNIRGECIAEVYKSVSKHKDSIRNIRSYVIGTCIHVIARMMPDDKEAPPGATDDDELDEATQCIVDEHDNSLEEYGIFLRAFGRLSWECKRIIVWKRVRALEGRALSHKEIADRLHVTENDSRQKLHRCTEKLKQLMSEIRKLDDM